MITNDHADTAMKLTIAEWKLIAEALNRAAIRQESEARYNPRVAGPHLTKAQAMRKLIVKIEEQR